MSFADNFFKALLEKDSSTLFNFLAEDYVHVTPERNTVISKGKWLENLSEMNTDISEIRVIFESHKIMAVHYTVNLLNGNKTGILSVSTLENGKLKRTEMGLTKA